jgi:DNA mismatch endonuclease (patch repair protein)
MRSNRSRDTSLELRIRRELFARGFRYRVNYRPLAYLRRTAGVVFTRSKIVGFIDGYFWHGCPRHYTSQKAPSEFSAAKVASNVERDLNTANRLEGAGWMVLRFWEHESTESVVSSISAGLDHRAWSVRSRRSMPWVD